MGTRPIPLSSATEERRPAIGALRVPRDEGFPALAVAGVVAVAAGSVVPAVEPADAAVPAGVAGPAAVAAGSVVLAAEPVDVEVLAATAGTLAAVAALADVEASADAGASVVLAVPVLWVRLGVPAGLGALADQVAPGERGASVALAAPAELAAPVPGAPARLASVGESAGQSALPVPAFLLDPAAMADD
jgi:hypothetical protein